jgi:tetratricopeptide (TPR) repeat protein
VAEALGALQRAIELRPNDLATLRSLMEINRTTGRLEPALSAANRLADADPDDAGAQLDVADLDIALGRFDDAAAAFERARQLDDEPDHDIYALHGMLLVELRRQDWQRAHEIAEEALRVDPSRRTESIFGFFAAQSAAPRPDHPGQAEVDQVLTASLAEHRRLHSEEFAVL